MKIKKIRMISAVILCLYTFLCGTPITARAVENNESSGGRVEESATLQLQDYGDEKDVAALSDNVRVSSRLWELLFKKEEKKVVSLIPGGDIFGVKLKQKYVSVVESEGIPALSEGDIILSINGKEIKSADEVSRLINASGGESVTIRARHKGEDIGIEIKPKYENGEYKLGISLRDGAMGIGTITFIDPSTGAFGGLGHGICDGSGDVIYMDSGIVSGALLGGIHRGETGKPGELTGILTEDVDGIITANNECGVFGVLNKIPDASAAISIGTRDQVHEGEATIISTLKNGKSAEYKIEILDIDRSSDGSKSFRIRVTDETLKALSGGIVRGMSGSPIIQDGKLVGAVTHVLVANPTEGYGIFIENMLNAAENNVPKAA